MLYITGDTLEVEAVLNVAYKYLFIMVSLLFILYLLHVYRSALQGMGDTVMPMVSRIVELVMRISAVAFLPLLIGEIGLYFSRSSRLARCCNSPYDRILYKNKQIAKYK